MCLSALPVLQLVRWWYRSVVLTDYDGQWAADVVGNICRPHPYAPNKPPLNYFTNAAAMALDTARDAVRFGPGDLKTSVGQLKPTAMLSQG